MTDHNFGIPFSHPDEKKQDLFMDRAKKAVVDKQNSGLDPEDEFFITVNDVYIVWFVKALQNWKALVSTNKPNGLYYEITYDGNVNQAYLDVYAKVSNTVISYED